MRGVIRFLVALFVLVVWELLMAMFFEDLGDVLKDMMPAGHSYVGNISTIESIMFLWAPMVFIFAWFVWSARYYVSPNTLVERRRPR